MEKPPHSDASARTLLAEDRLCFTMYNSLSFEKETNSERSVCKVQQSAGTASSQSLSTDRRQRSPPRFVSRWNPNTPRDFRKRSERRTEAFAKAVIRKTPMNFRRVPESFKLGYIFTRSREDTADARSSNSSWTAPPGAHVTFGSGKVAPRERQQRLLPRSLSAAHAERCARLATGVSLSLSLSSL